MLNLLDIDHEQFTYEPTVSISRRNAACISEGTRWKIMIDDCRRSHGFAGRRA
jgi:hypothetical protein